jgi:NAD(P)H-dependent FMN reductase
LSHNDLHLVVITASVREGRFGPTATRWFAERARAHGGFTVEVIDLADITLPHALPAVSPLLEPNPVRPGTLPDLTRALEAADAVVIVTPEINHSYPASVKTAIDWHFSQWSRKPIGFVGYSGHSGGLLAIEHLRGVFSELDAHTVRNFVSFPRFYELFDLATGTLIDPSGPEAAATTMLDQLHWWAAALAAARSAAAA